MFAGSFRSIGGSTVAGVAAGEPGCRGCAPTTAPSESASTAASSHRRSERGSVTGVSYFIDCTKATIPHTCSGV
jgi:hypothetical protein